MSRAVAVAVSVQPGRDSRRADSKSAGPARAREWAHSARYSSDDPSTRTMSPAVQAVAAARPSQMPVTVQVHCLKTEPVARTGPGPGLRVGRNIEYYVTHCSCQRHSKRWSGTDSSLRRPGRRAAARAEGTVTRTVTAAAPARQPQISAFVTVRVFAGGRTVRRRRAAALGC